MRSPPRGVPWATGRINAVDPDGKWEPNLQVGTLQVPTLNLAGGHLTDRPLHLPGKEAHFTLGRMHSSGRSRVTT